MGATGGEQREEDEVGLRWGMGRMETGKCSGTWRRDLFGLYCVSFLIWLRYLFISVAKSLITFADVTLLG